MLNILNVILERRDKKNSERVQRERVSKVFSGDTPRRSRRDVVRRREINVHEGIISPRETQGGRGDREASAGEAGLREGKTPPNEMGGGRWLMSLPWSSSDDARRSEIA